MDQPDPPELGPALMRWVNALGLSKNVASWKDLRDGQIFWEILASVEPDYFTDNLPEPHITGDNWIPKWQNLKYVNRQVTNYICDELKELPELSKRMDPDLKAIAIDAAVHPTMQLLKAILLAAMYSPVSNPRMVMIMNKIDQKDAFQIAECITQMQALDEKLGHAEERRDAASPLDSAFQADSRIASPLPDAGRDPLLEREEKLITAYAKIDDLEKVNASLNESLQKHAQKINELQDDLAEARDYLDHKGLSDEDNVVLNQLRQSSKRDQDYILELESELETLKESAESAERQLERLQADTEGKQKLRDDLQLLRVERDELLQKAKASDNLRKKIASLQDSEKNNLTLRIDYERAQEDLKALQSFKDRCARLQKQNEENVKLIQNSEQEIFDQKTTRKRLDHDMKALQQRLRTAEDRGHKDQETIREQEQRIRDLEAGAPQDSADPETLDEELTERQRSQNALKTRLAELEAEVSRFHARDAATATSDPSSAADPTTLQKQELLQSRAEKLEKQYLDLYQEHLALEATLHDASSGSTHSQPFIELRDRVRAEADLRAASDKAAFGAQSDLADAQRRAQAAEARLRALDQERGEALKTMQAAAEGDNGILHAENTRLLERIRGQDAEMEGQRRLLRHALLDAAALGAEEGGERARNEEAWVRGQLGLLREGEAEEGVVGRVARRVEDARGEGGASAEELQAHQATVADLQQRLAAAEAAAKDAAASKPTPLQTNTARELALMASAWYDMASRMQSDAVVLQRRSEGPKSFLGKQRRLVNLGRPAG